MSLPQCSSGQHAYTTPYIGFGGASGNTPQEVCEGVVLWHEQNGYSPSYVLLVNPSLCRFNHSGSSTGEYEITKVCTPEGETEEPPPVTTCSGACTVTVHLDASMAVQQLRAEVIAQIQDPSLIGLDSGDLAAAYAWSFGAVLACFVLGWLVSVALGVVRKV